VAEAGKKVAGEAKLAGGSGASAKPAESHGGEPIMRRQTPARPSQYPSLKLKNKQHQNTFYFC